MQYTVCSRGRPIGTTDLGFLPLHATARMGWFFPNEDGERVMPIVSAAPYALRAWGRAARAEEPDREATAAAEADLAEALHHIGAMELTIHRPDGTPLRTTDIGIRDTEAVVAAFGYGTEEGDDTIDDPDFEVTTIDADELHAMFGDDVDRQADEDAQFTCSRYDESTASWVEEPAPVFGRYQIVVTLAADEWIP